MVNGCVSRMHRSRSAYTQSASRRATASRGMSVSSDDAFLRVASCLRGFRIVGHNLWRHRLQVSHVLLLSESKTSAAFACLSVRAFDCIDTARPDRLTKSQPFLHLKPSIWCLTLFASTRVFLGTSLTCQGVSKFALLGSIGHTVE